MFHRRQIIRGALAVAALGAALACNDSATILVPPLKNALFTNFVSLGNSLTAGYQSGGINDSTQSRSYAVLVARQMGTRFAYPSLAFPGCPGPIANFQTQARVGGAAAPPCALRNPSSATNILNNVAVPGVTSFDPDAQVGPSGNGLTTLFLGGKSQVQKAIDAQPTFATVWVGNNDVLNSAVTGLPSTATPLATFTANYGKMINDLVNGSPGVKGVLIGVVQAGGAPILFSAVALQNPAFVAGLSAATGKAITIDPSCTATTTSKISFLLIGQIAAGTQPPTIACTTQTAGGLGDIYVLDAAEQLQVFNTVNSYNTYIKAKADSLGFAFYDPNVLFNVLIAAGQIPAVPNLASPTAPFGTAVSLDGIHPSSSTHILIANDIIATINAKFITNLKPAS